jgi:D-3-phosphoglycerate dehydrogenase
MQKVLICQPIHQSGVAVFGDGFEARIAPDPSEATVVREIRGVEGVVVRTAPFTRAIIEAADSLKVIGRHGVGVDNIDLAAATARGIIVVNTPNANAQSVAEHTVVAIGALSKRILPMHRATAQGKWEVRNEYKAFDLQGKTLGLVGLGRIGAMVAKKCAAAFDMNVVAYDPYTPAERAAAIGVRLADSLDEVLAKGDFVSLHTPLTPETRGLINAESLRKMKPHAYLINFSRGEVVDEAALVVALTNGTIAGAALDVYDSEPPKTDNPLFQLENVILSPHSAALTQECVIRMATGAAIGVKDVLEGRMPEFVVNKDVLPKVKLASRG